MRPYADAFARWRDGAGSVWPTLVATFLACASKEGAVLLDVGVSRVEDPQKGKKVLTGDIEPAAAERASWMSPNPGGVGPMTRAMLLVNVVTAAERLAQQG